MTLDLHRVFTRVNRSLPKWEEICFDVKKRLRSSFEMLAKGCVCVNRFILWYGLVHCWNGYLAMLVGFLMVITWSKCWIKQFGSLYADVDSTKDKILMVYGQSLDRAAVCCTLNDLLSIEWRLVDWYFWCVCLWQTLEECDVSIEICIGRLGGAGEILIGLLTSWSLFGCCSIPVSCS